MELDILLAGKVWNNYQYFLIQQEAVGHRTLAKVTACPRT